MAWRPHGRASVNRFNPEAWAICDDCGMLYLHKDLRFQYEWLGAKLQKINFLKCERCYDTPQEQNRVIVLPTDPVPIKDPRPELYISLTDPISGLSLNPVSSLSALNQTAIGNLTQAAGLLSAFDANTNKPMFQSAASFISNSSFNTVGRFWGNSLTTNGLTAGSFAVWAPNDAKFFGGGPTSYFFQGSNDGVLWNNLSSGTTSGTIGENFTVTMTPTTQYFYHRFAIVGDGINSAAVAQLKINSVDQPSYTDV